jgi:V8-like Glu-specific endopeptidase
LDLGAAALGEDKTIYGEDDRIELSDPSIDADVMAAARSTAALIPRSSLTADGTDFRLPSETFGQNYQLCDGERFADQPNPASCSGFLVESQVMVTAASCIRSQTDCSDMAVVFDFANQAGRTDAITMARRDNVYYCAGIVQRLQGGPGNPDFAIIRLDRAVTGRAPLRFRRRDDTLRTGDGVIAVGHPSGLPMKVMEGARVMTTAADAAYFTTNVDAFGGALGSPVLSATDHVVEGILARGQQDYVMQNGCSVAKRCSEDEACAGQEATRTSLISEFVEDPTRPTAIEDHEFAGLDLPIPDADNNGITYDMPITQEAFVANVKVYVKITHTYTGDLRVSLIHPDGTEFVLHDRAGGSTDNIDQEFDLARNFREKSSSGTWKLKVQDLAGQDVGKLTYVKLTLKTFLE